MCTMLQGKTYILLMLPTIKSGLTAKRFDSEMVLFELD